MAKGKRKTRKAPTEKQERRAGAQASRWTLILDRLASSKTGFTVDELADEFSCTTRTIYRDLQQLEEWLHVPFVKEGEDESGASGSSRWKLMEGSRFRPAIEFSPSELLSLLAAGAILEPLKNTPWGAGLASLQAKLKGRLSSETVKRIESEAAELAAAPPPATDYRKHALTVDVLMKAAREHTTVEMRYHSLSSGKTTTRKLDPYRLWYVDGALYVVGACHVHDHEARTFAVDRIKSISATAQRFTIPKDFAWESYTRDSFRLFRGGEPVEVAVHFAPGLAPVLRSRKFHPSQQVAELEGGGVRVTMRVAGLFEIVAWILGFGSQARAVSPPELVRLVREEIAKMSSAYEGAVTAKPASGSR